VELPDFVTHYHLSDRAPFLNLSDLEGDRLWEVVGELMEMRRSTPSARVFGRPYVELRRLTEERLRELFIARGGRPERSAPHYFCLGSCAWFKGLYGGLEEVVVPLSALPSEATSVTLPDSVTAMGLGVRFGLPDDSRPYHGRVFLLEELPELVAEYGLPSGEVDDFYEGYESRPFEKYIEVQLWSDEPIASLRLASSA